MYNLQHPYVDNMDVSYNINIPGASSMTIVFDPLSCTDAVRGGAFAAHSATLLRPCDVSPELAYSVVKLLILCIFLPIGLDDACAELQTHDWVEFYDSSARANMFGVRYHGGRNGSDRNYPGIGSTPPLVVPNRDSLVMVFHSDGSNVDWGVK